MFLGGFARFFGTKYQHILWIWFFSHVTEILFANIWKKFQGSSFPSELSRDLYSTGGKQKFAIFKIFRAYLEFSVFLHEIFIVDHLIKFLRQTTKVCLSPLVILKTRIRVPILQFFDDFLAFFTVSVFAQAFELGQWFFYENLVQSIYFYMQ